MRKLQRILCMCMVLALCLPMLFACGGDGATTTRKDPAKDTTKGGGTPDDGFTVGDLGTDTIHINISVNQDSETTFPAQDRYVKGPDKVGEDEVQNMVFRRNEKIRKTLGLTVRYTETDLSVEKVLADVEKLAMAGGSDTPDIYNNDLQGLSHAMVVGYLRNLLHPGAEEDGQEPDNYFNFDLDCWYGDYMRGATLDESKIYLAAGDCFLDLIRFAWVLYVNMDLFDNAFATIGYDTVTFYQLVLEGEWDYDLLMSLCEQAFRDTNGNGVADKEDERLGLIEAHLLSWVCTWTSGLDVVDHTKATPEIIEKNNQLYTLYDRFSQLYNTKGVYHADQVLNAITLFLNGTAVFGLSELGEMESETVRAANFRKGLVPIPKFDLLLQPKYHTAIHNQAEVAAVLINARHFTAASAYLQLMCMESTDILHEYYESSLKYKYNDEKETKAMIDLVHDTIDSPFIVLLSRILFERTNRNETVWNMILTHAKKQDNGFASDYESYYGDMKAALEKMIQDYSALE